MSQHTEFIYKQKTTNLRYIYIYKSKNEIPVTVSFVDVQYHSQESFSFKYDVILVTKYISNEFLHHSILPSSSKLLTYILLRIGFLQ